MTLPNSQATFWQETELPLMSSREVFHAKTLAQQESKPVSVKAPAADCGLSAYASFAKYDPTSQSLRTSQTCLVARLSVQGDGLAEYSATFPASGMMRNGTLFHLATLEAGPSGREYGFLPTPLKTSGKGSPYNRFFGSPHYRSNYAEGLRNGMDDPLYPTPDFAERVMGFPTGWTELPE